MKHTQLKQLIKEEIHKVLSEDHKPGDKVIYAGLGVVTIDKEEDGLIYFSDKNGKTYKKNYNQFKQASQPFHHYLNPIHTPLHEYDRTKWIHVRAINHLMKKHGEKAQQFVADILDGRELESLSTEELMDLNLKLINSLPDTSTPLVDPDLDVDLWKRTIG